MKTGDHIISNINCNNEVVEKYIKLENKVNDLENKIENILRELTKLERDKITLWNIKDHEDYYNHRGLNYED